MTLIFVVCVLVFGLMGSSDSQGGSDTPQTGPRPTHDAGPVGGARIVTGEISGEGCVADANGCTDAMVMVSAGPPYQVGHGIRPSNCY